jgi:hypothetical protein
LTEREKYDENALIEKWLALNTESAKGMLKLPIAQKLLV